MEIKEKKSIDIVLSNEEIMMLIKCSNLINDLIDVAIANEYDHFACDFDDDGTYIMDLEDLEQLRHRINNLENLIEIF